MQRTTGECSDGFAFVYASAPSTGIASTPAACRALRLVQGTAACADAALAAVADCAAGTSAAAGQLPHNARAHHFQVSGGRVAKPRHAKRIIGALIHGR